VPVLALCAAIFIQSSFPSPDLGPSFPMQDKVLHLMCYGLLAALCFRACRLTWPDWNLLYRVLFVSVLFASLYGAGDEFHQSFVAARQADGFDLLADTIGSLLGATLWLLVTRKGSGRRRT
jgi:VanZ family protein